MSVDPDSVAIVGAGPAGLAAACTLTAAGRRCVLIDMGRLPGGQFWRHPDTGLVATLNTAEGQGQHHWSTFTRMHSQLADAARSGLLDHRPGTQVWAVERSDDGRFVLQLTRSVTSDRAGAPPAPVAARTLILAAGAYDRQLPFPGWTLPGVMAAGGVQALLKSSRIVAGASPVVAGTGPFLLPVAAGLARAGARHVQVCDANSPSGWARDPWGAVQAPSKALEAVQYSASFLRHRVRMHHRTAVVAAMGAGRVEAVRLARLTPQGVTIPGSEWEIPADLVATGWGFIPSLELPLDLGAATRVGADGSLIVDADAECRTSVPGLLAAGETVGVAGAVQAMTQGELAGITALCDSGATVPEARRRTLRARARRGARFAGAMHRAAPVPRNWASWLTDDTVICRCEEVTHGALRRMPTDLGAREPRTLRVAGRAGMGMCQGRVCGFAVACLGHRQGGDPAEELTSLGRRPVAVPVPLAEIARSHTCQPQTPGTGAS